jgi:hypothetical protein
MAADDFQYGSAGGATGSLSVSIYSDRPQMLAEMHEDAGDAGLSVRIAGTLGQMLQGDAVPLGDVVFVDCPALEAEGLAALSRMDDRVARSGAHLIVSTSVEALDDVFACCDQSGPQILVSPGRAERIVALGRLVAEAPSRRVRELCDDDRLTLLRLTEQVAQLGEKLEHLGGADAKGRSQEGGFRFESPAVAFAGKERDPGSERLVRPARPPLPDPRLVRRIIRQRQLRGRFFDAELFADPAWDMLLDLTAARAEHERVSVTSLCIASGVPPTTALRWIGQMREAGLFERVEDECDRRRAFIGLTDTAVDGMARYFAELGQEAGELV